MSGSQLSDLTWIDESLDAALRLMLKRPGKLLAALSSVRDFVETVGAIGVQDVEDRLRMADAGEGVVRIFRRALMSWDAETPNGWTGTTERNHS